MSQNIVQQREAIMRWIDHVRSPRFTDIQYQASINSAIRKIVDDRYDNLRQNKSYSFESIQRIRSELYTLVNNSGTITTSGNYIPIASFPTKFDYLLNVKVTIDSEDYNAIPITHDKKNIIDNDPFDKPDLTFPDNVYYVETSSGLEIIKGDLGTLSSGEFDYLASPNEVDFGTLVESTDASPHFSSDTTVIANDVTVYNAVTYQIGETINIDIGVSTDITSGSVYYGYTNHNMPVKLETEISQLAAALIMISPENFAKSQVLEYDSKKT